MANSVTDNLAELNSHGRRWMGASGEAAQRALSSALEIALNGLEGYMAQMFDRVDDALFDRAEKGSSTELQNQYFDALRQVRLVRSEVCASFSALVIRAFERGAPKDMEIPGELRLHSEVVPERESASAEEQLAIAATARKIRTNCTDSLHLLDRRMGFLLEDPDLECWENPLGPKVLCDAFEQAAERIDTDLVVRLVVFKFFDQGIAAELQGLYKEINHALLQAGVLPGMQPRATDTATGDPVAMAPGIVPTRGDKALEPAAEAVPMATGIVPGRQTGYLGSGDVEDAWGDADESYDDFMPLDNLAETVPMAPGIVPSGPAKTPYPPADSVPMAPGIVPSGRMLRPFKKKPAQATAARREVLQRQAETSFQQLEPAPVVEAQKEPVAEARKQRVKTGLERLQEAESDAEKTVLVYAGDNAPAVGFVAEFVAGPWRDLLKLICMRDGKESNAWKQAVTTMDDLVWSVKPKQREQQRQRLKLIQPRLIKHLRLGMQRLSRESDECNAFIDCLEDEYRRLLTPEEPSAAVAEVEQLVEPVILDEETSEEIAAASEVFSGKSLAFKAGATKQKGLEGWQNGDRYTQMANRLKTGDWVEFSSPKGAITHAKLSWNSPITNTLLFTDRQGLQAGNYSLDEFAKLLRLSRARLLDNPPRAGRSVKSHR